MLRREDRDDDALPRVLGYFTLSMAVVTSGDAGAALGRKLPKYPMPVALIGRLAVDDRARGRRFGELMLVDALRRVLDAAQIVGCLGVIVDAKDEDAQAFYAKYDFVSLTSDGWPRRMFLSIDIVRSSFAPPQST